MPEPVSTTLGIGLIGYAALQGFARRDGSAMSLEAGVVRQAAMELVERAKDSRALFGIKSDALSNLFSFVRQVNSEGICSIDASTVKYAVEFLCALPNDIILPEFATDPDGGISFDWIQTRNQIFSISIGPSNRLAYAWTYGLDSGHGVARFDGREVPAIVLAGIRSVLDYESTSIGIA
jgi:hypothetical protein